MREPAEISRLAFPICGRALCSALLACFVLSAVFNACCLGQEIPKDADEVAQLIADLDDDRFHVREAALRRLSELDSSVVPRLADAAIDGSMEVVIRAISAMKNIAAKNPDASPLVEEHLRRLGQPNYTLAGQHAQRALQELAVIEGERTREFLLTLGARYGTGNNTGVGVPGPGHMEFTQEWHGTAEEFGKVRMLYDLHHISLIGQSFDDEYLADLLAVPNLRQVDLYNTKFSTAAVAQVFAKLGNELDHRKGAKLGVTAVAIPLRCLIDDVVPGSAADKAGMIGGDIVTAADGKQVRDFDELNAIIAQKSPGDTLELEISRNQRKLKVTATLGGWSP